MSYDSDTRNANGASDFVKNVDTAAFGKEIDQESLKLRIYAPIEDAKQTDDAFFLKLPVDDKQTADDICLYVCQKLGIGPVARQLFALQINGSNLYLSPSKTLRLTAERDACFDFRIRFKMASVEKLLKIDPKAFDYMFYQVRYDLVRETVVDLNWKQYSCEILGLVTCDLYRVMLERNISKKSVLKEYAKFVPKRIHNKHLFFLKKPLSKAISELETDPDVTVGNLKQTYLLSFMKINKNYPFESYKAVSVVANRSSPISIRITPFDAEQPGIRIANKSKSDDYEIVCSIEELYFISINGDNTVEISRKNGIPVYLKFNSDVEMTSFVSLLDGYYRMMVKWTFNLCKDLPTHSLVKLYENKCHGPIGGTYSYLKLEQKRNNSTGCYILRECDKKYHEYYIDVCTTDRAKPQSFKIEKLKTDEFIFNGDVTRYKSLTHLTKSYSNPKSAVFLNECLPPSEYDESPLLLLCKPEVLGAQTYSEIIEMNDFSTFRTILISTRELQVFKSKKLDCYDGAMSVYHSIWKVNKFKKIDVALKTLNSGFFDKYLTEFNKLVHQWSTLHANSIVRIYAYVNYNPVAMVTEYMKYGPLDEYLRANGDSLSTSDLVEASSNLAAALFHLEEKNLIHGNIRCKKLFVATHNEKSFTVKLSDPGLYRPCTKNDIHWIPCEFYLCMDNARKEKTTDTWALATTLWEIFNNGQSPANIQNAKNNYLAGKRLPKTPKCPMNMYEIMLECWDIDPDKRKNPQEISRDINRIMYQLYNTKETHAYAKIALLHCKQPSSSSSLSSLSSKKNLTEKREIDSCHEDESSGEHSRVGGGSLGVREAHSVIPGAENDDFSNSNSLKTNYVDFGKFSATENVETVYTTQPLWEKQLEFQKIFTKSMTSIDSIESVFEFDEHCNVVLQSRIGQGFYGEVFKGKLEWFNEEKEAKKVAIKKLKSSVKSQKLLDDFKREIKIMKSLKHPNIVEIMGVIEEPEISLVMEYFDHGSLQSYLKIHKESLSIRQLLKYSVNIAEGMHYLGQKHIVHRDLAARNILVANDNTIKISDFGLAQSLGANDYYILKTNRDLPINWYALESLEYGKFSSKTDVWSYGVTLFEIFSHGGEPQIQSLLNEPLIRGQEAQMLTNALKNGARYSCPLSCPQSIYVRVIHPCWRTDPHQRPTFSQLKAEIVDLLDNY